MAASRSLSDLLAATRAVVEPGAQPLPAPFPAAVLFFSVSDGASRARVVTAVGATFEQAWREGASRLRALVRAAGMAVNWLRVDRVDDVETLSWRALHTRLAATKRNYFRHGLALDAAFDHAYLETELNANAMLYGGNAVAHAVVNQRNFRRYAARRHGLRQVDFTATAPVYAFSASGAFADAAHPGAHPLAGAGRQAGRRIIARLAPAQVRGMIAAASRYLATQVQAGGRFHYGWHACFDRPINTYNSLRHASTLYAMLEALEAAPGRELELAIGRALDHLVSSLIRKVTLASGVGAAFLLDEGNEIKLGGNAVCLLALVKHSELTGSRRHLALMAELAEGIAHMQDGETGSFHHVLSYPGLELKDAFRTIYYEGEAAFGLMRLYGLTREPRWLAMVERAFEHFIAAEHWRAHDHWLGYCVNELTRYRPCEKYFDFGVSNVADHLDFVSERITTFPTLLELMMAAESMLARMRGHGPRYAHLLARIDLAKFRRALHIRAHYLMNGHFWPELAMYYANPARIVGSFFIRHHAFRVRIDDVEHYLSGYIAYLGHLERERRQVSPIVAPPPPPPPSLPAPASAPGGRWTAEEIARAVNGVWVAPPPAGWRTSGLCIYAPARQPGDVVAVRAGPGDERGVPVAALARLRPAPAAIMTSMPEAIALPGIPVLRVPSVGDAVLAMGSHARRHLAGKLLAVTGSAGKTTTVAMLADALGRWGPVGRTRHNANLPHGVAWNLASLDRGVPHIVLELAVGRMRQSALMARPDVAVFTNVLPAHLGAVSSVRDIAIAKSHIFAGMASGGVAVLNRDMREWAIVNELARQRGLTVLRYGTAPECEFRLLDYEALTGQVTALCLGRRLEYRLAARGRHMALNSVAVLAAVAALGYDAAAAVPGLAAFTPLSGRGMRLALDFHGRPLNIIDDAYNANPGSMRAAIETLASEPGVRRVAVLGEMAELGPDAARYHTELADLMAAHGIDVVHTMGGLYDGFRQRLAPARRGRHVGTLEEMRAALCADLCAGDVVLLKGSHATGMHELVAWLRASSGRRVRAGPA